MSSDGESDYEQSSPVVKKTKRATRASKADKVVELEPEQPVFEGDLNDDDFTPFPFLKDIELEAPKKAKGGGRKKKLYLPKPHSAASAVLIALHQLIYNDDSKHLGSEIPKADIIEESSKYTPVTMEASGDEQYGGYSSTKTLLTHGLILKVAAGRRVVLTKAGAFTAIICIARDGVDSSDRVSEQPVTIQRVADLVKEWYQRGLPLEIDQEWVIEQYRAENAPPKPAKKPRAPKKAKVEESETENDEASD